MEIPNFDEERKLWKIGYKFVCGIDEVGRGAWAGPVVAAAVIFAPEGETFPSGFTLKVSPSRKLKIRDSKQLSPQQREGLDLWIRENCLAYSIAKIGVKIINREGVAKATQRAFRKCLRNLKVKPDFILIDAFYVQNLSKRNQKPIIKGDQKSVSIAAASIIAKVYRDNLTVRLHGEDSRYHFDLHKGYGTKIHQEAIKKHGLSRHHRPEFVTENLTERREHPEGVDLR